MRVLLEWLIADMRWHDAVERYRATLIADLKFPHHLRHSPNRADQIVACAYGTVNPSTLLLRQILMHSPGNLGTLRIPLVRQRMKNLATNIVPFLVEAMQFDVHQSF